MTPRAALFTLAPLGLLLGCSESTDALSPLAAEAAPPPTLLTPGWARYLPRWSPVRVPTSSGDLLLTRGDLLAVPGAPA